ncbi:hypothetical protein [Wenzhouxiangella sp. EGI_FJ10409]|uniref:hypothetical protein n=1 Tax=Wenzhouxiangella sp. EGI_FJ10409 TaxID=3243767 RepID=UPI0035D854BE
MRFIAILLLSAVLALPASASDTTITYQGQLQNNGTPHDGTVNLDIRLFDDADAGQQIGATQEFLGHPVVDGLFRVDLDFGPGAFDGGERWLEIRVDGTPLDERQPVATAPVAQFALDAPDVLTELSCNSGEVPKWNGTDWQCAIDEFEPAVWSLDNSVAVFAGDAVTDGNHEVTGQLDVGEELAFNDQTPQRTAGPIAKGSINSDGSVENAVNVSNVTWNENSERYEISISGEPYYFDEYVTSVTITELDVVRTRLGSGLNRMYVYLYDESGNLVQGKFQFVTYKLPEGSVEN